MHNRLPALSILILLLSASQGRVADTATATSTLDTARIEQLTGAKGQLDAKEGVFKVSMPRADLGIRAAGVHVTPPLGELKANFLGTVREGSIWATTVLAHRGHPPLGERSTTRSHS